MKNLVYLFFVGVLFVGTCSCDSLVEDVVDDDVDEVVVEEVVGDDEDEDTSGSEDSEEDNSIPDLPYDEISQTKYTIDVEYWDIPNDGTEAVKTTQNLQAAIDWAVGEGYGVICLPAGHYLVGEYQNSAFQKGIVLSSNMAFILDDDAIIEMVPNDLRNYYIIAVTAQKYVYISGGTVLGDRDDHFYDDSSTHEGGHCIAIIQESEYVTVENMSLSKGTGDGILIEAAGEEGSSVKYVDIRENDIFDNRRQGISIVGGVDIVIEDNEIHHIDGTAPQFGIDIESEDYFSENIEIRSNYFHHNNGGNIVNFDAKKLTIEDNVMEQGDDNNYTDGAVVLWESSDLIMRGNEITSNYDDETRITWCGIQMYPSENRSTSSATAYINDNTFYNCGIYMKNGANLNIYDNVLNNGFMNFYDTSNLSLSDNKVDRDWAVCVRYAFDNVSGEASGNELNGEVYEIPLSSDAYSGESCD